MLKSKQKSKNLKNNLPLAQNDYFDKYGNILPEQNKESMDNKPNENLNLPK